MPDPRRRGHGRWCRNPVESFRRVRGENYELLKELPEAAYARTGNHSERGPITLRFQLELLAEHAESHARQMQGIREEYKKAKGKKRKLNMQGEDACKAQFWSVKEVLKVQAEMKAKDDEEEQEKIAKAQKKASAEAIRKQKEKEKQEKAIEAAVARQIAKEAKARRQAEEREIREAAKKAKALEKASEKLPKASLKARQSTTKSKTDAQASRAVRVEAQEEEGVQKKTRTRVVKPPPHFEYK